MLLGFVITIFFIVVSREQHIHYTADQDRFFYISTVTPNGLFVPTRGLTSYHPFTTHPHCGRSGKRDLPC